MGLFPKEHHTQGLQSNCLFRSNRRSRPQAPGKMLYSFYVCCIALLFGLHRRLTGWRVLLAYPSVFRLFQLKCIEDEMNAIEENIDYFILSGYVPYGAGFWWRSVFCSRSCLSSVCSGGCQCKIFQQKLRGKPLKKRCCRSTRFKRQSDIFRL